MNGNTPTLISGVPKVALSLATIRSQASASPERARQHVTVGRADRGLAELEDRLEEPREALGAEVLVHERHVRGELVEAAARREDLLVRGGEHHAAHAVVGARQLERADQIREQLVRQRVARIGLVHRDRGDAIGAHLIANRLGGTRRFLLRSAGPQLRGDACTARSSSASMAHPPRRWRSTGPSSSPELRRPAPRRERVRAGSPRGSRAGRRRARTSRLRPTSRPTPSSQRALDRSRDEGPRGRAACAEGQSPRTR